MKSLAAMCMTSNQKNQEMEIEMELPAVVCRVRLVGMAAMAGWLVVWLLPTQHKCQKVNKHEMKMKIHLTYGGESMRV